jgi:hypothetical protein
MPISLRALFSATQRASVNLNFSQPSTGSPSSTLSAIRVPTPMAQA